MTITSAFSTITNSIAALSISGVSVKDIDEIPQGGELITPVLFPQPIDFVTNFSPSRVTLGSNGTAKIDLTYNLNYVLLYTHIGSGIATYDIYSGLISVLSTIVVAILNNDAITGLVDLQIGNINGPGVIEDPSGKEYWGILFSLRILEYAQ